MPDAPPLRAEEKVREARLDDDRQRLLGPAAVPGTPPAAGPGALREALPGALREALREALPGALRDALPGALRDTSAVCVDKSRFDGDGGRFSACLPASIFLLKTRFNKIIIFD